MNAIVTGASRGIGRACAEALADAGYRVTAVARTESELRELQRSHPSVEPLIADLTRTVPTGTYDVVVLNAGWYAPGGLLDPGRDVFGESWELNVMANHRLARALLPPLIERGSGHLLVIGSSATDDTSDHMTAYGATKKCLRILYEGWEKELKGSGVRTTLVAPGATLTSSWDGETPPPRILSPGDVADLLLRCIREGLTGRHSIKA